MKYTFNGRTLTIPDAELESSMTALGLSQEEAIEMWLDDNEYTTNEEVERLTRLARENKTDKVVGSSTKTRKPRAKSEKVDEQKIELIKRLYEAVEEFADSAEIANPTKLIKFTVGEETFKIDLIRERKAK